MDVLATCMYVHQVCTYPQRPEVLSLSRSGVTDYCKPSCGSLESQIVSHHVGVGNQIQIFCKHKYPLTTELIEVILLDLTVKMELKSLIKLNESILIKSDTGLAQFWIQSVLILILNQTDQHSLERQCLSKPRMRVFC